MSTELKNKIAVKADELISGKDHPDIKWHMVAMAEEILNHPEEYFEQDISDEDIQKLAEKEYPTNTASSNTNNLHHEYKEIFIKTYKAAQSNTQKPYYKTDTIKSIQKNLRACFSTMSYNEISQKVRDFVEATFESMLNDLSPESNTQPEDAQV